MSQMITLLVFVLMCILGGLSSVFVVIGIPGVLVWKIYRRIRYGEKLMS